jgi:uncharacterized protein YkwD
MTPKLFQLLLLFSVALNGAGGLLAQKRPTAKPATVNVPSQPAPANTTSAPGLDPALTLLAQSEKQLLEEINFARANPGEYLKALEAFRKNFRGKEIHYPEGGVLVTNEGTDALDDAIKFLRDVKPLPPLELRSGMVQAAKVHANDLASSGKSGHRGSDGSQAGERIDRFGAWDDSYGENIVYDSRTPRYDVIGMLIDDGTANRGHRENLFAEDFRVVGIATGKRANGVSFVVLTFAGGFREKK